MKKFFRSDLSPEQCRIVARIALLATLSLLYGVPAYSEEAKSDVLIVMPKNLNFPPANVVIYRVPEDKDEWPTVAADIPIEGETKASLAEGQYVAEVGAVVDNVLILLQSPPFTAQSAKRVVLTAERHTVGATIGNKSARLLQVALRRFGSGEVRWNADKNPPPIELYISPGRSYVASSVSVLGTKYLAYWTAKEPIKKSKLSFSDVGADRQMKFAVRDGTPALAASFVTVSFPDSSLTIADPARAVLMTNQERAHCDYELNTKAGEKFCFMGGAWSSSEPIFKIGGSFTPKMFAGFIWSEGGNGWESGKLLTRVELLDEDGRVFDGGKSQANYRTELFLAPEDEKPVLLEGLEPGHSGFKANTILAKVSYSYGGRNVASECRGEELVRVSSEHFSLATPSMWKFKARQFLSCLEAIRLLTMKNTGRNGPATYRVDWRGNGGDAKSIVGSGNGERDLWMSFPWWTFDSFWDPFTEPWFGNHDPYVCHEVLHAFGYHHGDEMSRLEWKAEDQYRALRWKAVDDHRWPVGQLPMQGE